MIELGNFTEQKNQVLHRRVICFFMYRNEIVPFIFSCRDGAKDNLMARGLITTKTE